MAAAAASSEMPLSSSKASPSEEVVAGVDVQAPRDEGEVVSMLQKLHVRGGDVRAVEEVAKMLAMIMAHAIQLGAYAQVKAHLTNVLKRMQTPPLLVALHALRAMQAYMRPIGVRNVLAAQRLLLERLEKATKGQPLMGKDAETEARAMALLPELTYETRAELIQRLALPIPVATQAQMVHDILHDYGFPSRDQRVLAAHRVATQLNLQPYISPPEMILQPLVQAKKYKEARAYVENHREQLGDILINLEAYANPTQAMKLIRAWNLSPDDYPVVMQESYKRTARYLISQGKMLEFADEFDYNEPVRTFIVKALLQKGQANSAAQVAIRFNLDNHPVASGLVRSFRKNPASVLDSTRPDNGQPTLALEAHVANSLLMVDSDESTEQMAAAIRELRAAAPFCGPKPVVGLDAEFMPSFFGDSNSPSVLQISTHNRCFLVDLLVAESLPSLEAVIGDLFSCDDIIKVGYAFDNDLKLLRRGLPTLNCFQGMREVLDLQAAEKHLKLYDRIKRARKAVPDCLPQMPPNGGLSRLVRLTLGLPLDKTCQMSNWNRRPLRQDQMRYAALDAYCEVAMLPRLEHVLSVIRSALPSDNVPELWSAARSLGQPSG